MDAAAAWVALDTEADRHPRGECGHVRDHADHAPCTRRERLQCGRDSVQSGLIQGAEALVDEDRLELRCALARERAQVCRQSQRKRQRRLEGLPT